MKRIESAIKISAIIAALIGGMPAFAQNDIEVTFYQGKYGYNIVSYAGGNCAGLTCHFPPDQINNVRVKLNVNGTTNNCFFTGGTLKQGTPYFTGSCPMEQVGTVIVKNSLITNPNNPVIVNLP